MSTAVVETSVATMPTNRTKAPVAAKKKKKRSKARFVRDLPRGVYKLPSGKFQSSTCWGGKTRQIGAFDTPKQASAAFFSVREEIDDAKLSALTVDEASALFDAAKKKALDLIGMSTAGEPESLGHDDSADNSDCVEEYELSTCCECLQVEDPTSGIPVLLCDGCDAPCHLSCTIDRPKLTTVPDGDWYCSRCMKKKSAEDLNEVRACSLPKKRSHEATPGRVTAVEEDTCMSCVICQDATKRILLLPCKHVCLCIGCSEKEKPTECPMCRAKISEMTEVFF
jgi:hypothetical protein